MFSTCVSVSVLACLSLSHCNCTCCQNVFTWVCSLLGKMTALFRNWDGFCPHLWKQLYTLDRWPTSTCNLPDHFQFVSTFDSFIMKVTSVFLSALTLDDEKRVIAHLLCGFISRVSFGRDFEQQLSFYVEARASFSNLDPVLITLIQVNVHQLLFSLSPAAP